jgi:hypothetical protein
MAARALDETDTDFAPLLSELVEATLGTAKDEPFWRDGKYATADRQQMLRLLRDHGYRAGQHMADVPWSDELTNAGGYEPGMVVSSYALYLIALADVPMRCAPASISMSMWSPCAAHVCVVCASCKLVARPRCGSVLTLEAFQNGRMRACHAAPFDAAFRLQANVAVGGNFFKGNMNTADGLDTMPPASSHSANGAADDGATPDAAEPRAEEATGPPAADAPGREQLAADVPEQMAEKPPTEHVNDGVHDGVKGGALPYGADAHVAGCDGVQFLRNRRAWLGSWLADPRTLDQATFDEATFDVRTPRLGRHTRFVLHAVAHVPVEAWPWGANGSK